MDRYSFGIAILGEVSFCHHSPAIVEFDNGRPRKFPLAAIDVHPIPVESLDHGRAVLRKNPTDRCLGRWSIAAAEA